MMLTAKKGEGSDMRRKMEVAGKAVGAGFLISLGAYALLKLGNPLGPFMFAFGLLGVCFMKQNLFTGKCGFMFADRIRTDDLMIILVFNLITGWLFGFLYSYLDADIVSAAVSRVEGWEFTFAFFVKAMLCGAVMYIAVEMYKKGTPLGIIFGVPLFIFCGLQHCIANVIYLGVARTMDWSLVLAIFGNWAGSLLVWLLTKSISLEKLHRENKEMKHKPLTEGDYGLKANKK